MRHTPLVLFALVLIAVAAVLFLRESGPAVPPAGGDAAAAPPAAVAPGDLADAAKGETAASASTTAPAPVERTAAAGVEPDAANGAVFVRGRLVDPQRAPRAGVGVAFHVWRGLGDWDGPMPTLGTNTELVEGTTGADGRFVLRLPRGRDGRMTLPGGELVFADAAPEVRGANVDQDLGDVVAEGAARIAGVVQDENGRPLAGVKVTARNSVFAFGSASSSVSDREGRFELGKLTRGTWTLRTASANHLPAVQEIVLAGEEQRAGVVIALGRGAAVSGQVVDDRGLPVAGLKVAAQRQEERGEVRIARFAADEATETDAAGYFTLAGLAGQTATVRAFGRGHTEAEAAGVAVGTGDLVLTVQRLGVIEGVLLGAGGEPIGGSEIVALRGGAGADAEVDVVELEGPMVPFLGNRARTHTAADGTFRLENVRPGAVTVLARGKTHRPARQTGLQLAPAQVVRGVRLVAELGATAVVEVVDEAGQPIAGAKVRARPPAGAAPAEGMRFRAVRAEASHDGVAFEPPRADLASAATDKDGIARLEGLPAGSIELHAEHEQFAAAAPQLVVAPRAGEVAARLALRTPAYAAVVVTDADGAPAAGVEVEVSGPLGGADSRTQRAATDAEGRVRIGPLVAGDHVATLRRPNAPARVGDAMVVLANGGGAIAGSERAFVAVAGKDTVVELQKPRAVRLHGVVTGAEGAVSGCRVELASRADDGPQLPGFGGGRTATTDGDGLYAFEDVEPGEYTLRYGPESSRVKAKTEVDVVGDRSEVRQDLQLRTGTFRVQVLDRATGAPIAGAEVELEVQQPEAPAGERRVQRAMMISVSADGRDGGEATTITVGDQSSRTGADGWAQIDDVPVGTYEARIRHEAHVAATRRDQAVLERQVTDAGRVELDAAGRLRGSVLAADGGAVRLVLVEYRSEDGKSTDSQPAMGGRFTFGSIPPGKYTLRARELPFGPGAPGEWGPSTEVEVRAGAAATAELRLPAK